MAAIPISGLAALVAWESADLLPVVDTSDTSQGPNGSTKKITIANLFQNVVTNGTSGTYSLTVGNNQSAGQNNGLNIIAGGNSADFCLRAQTKAGVDKFVIRGDGAIGVFGATPITKPTVTGAKGGNAGLTSLCTQLAALGWITDSTT